MSYSPDLFLRATLRVPIEEVLVGLKPSSELEAVARRWVVAVRERDFETAANLFYRGDEGRYIGSDSHEWWRGPTFVDVFPQHQDELPEITMEIEEVEAYEFGTAGWAAVRTMSGFGGEQPRSLRMTFVFTLESGFWKIVQTHLSFAIPNPEILGLEMTRSLEDLLASLDPGSESRIRSSVQHGTVTLMFTDIEGSTSLAAQVGDERWAETIEWHNATIQRIVESCNGILVKTLGDGTMAAFEAVREGARAATRIHEAFARPGEMPELGVRIGLHVGDVVRSGDDYLGNSVNKAARITAAGEPGEITASGAVRALLADDPEFDFGDIHMLHLKGIEGVHEVSSVRHPYSPPGRAV